jgi:hypothetical protein
MLGHFGRHRPACLLGTLHKPNPQGLGRIVRDAGGNFLAIVEEKDATDDQRRLTEVNMSTYLFSGSELLHALDRLKNDNRQREYYLTDCPGILKTEGKRVEALPGTHDLEASDGRVRFAVDGEHLDGAVKHVSRFGLRALTSHPPTLEELMLRHYGDDLARGGGGAS